MVSPAKKHTEQETHPTKTQIKPTYLTTPTPSKEVTLAPLQPTKKTRRLIDDCTEKGRTHLISFLLHQRPKGPDHAALQGAPAGLHRFSLLFHPSPCFFSFLLNYRPYRHYLSIFPNYYYYQGDSGGQEGACKHSEGAKSPKPASRSSGWEFCLVPFSLTFLHLLAWT